MTKSNIVKKEDSYKFVIELLHDNTTSIKLEFQVNIILYISTSIYYKKLSKIMIELFSHKMTQHNF